MEVSTVDPRIDSVQASALISVERSLWYVNFASTCLH